MMESDAMTSQLGTESIKRLLIRFTIPAITGLIIVSLYNIVDRIFVGHGIGVLAISGLSLTMPISNMVAAIGTLVGVGASARISIVLGKGDYNWARNILAHVPMLTLIISAIFTLFSMLYLDELLTLFGGSPDTIPYAKEYLNIVIPASVFTNLCFSLSAVIRGTGNPRKSMYVVVVGILLNIILDPIFIFVFDMGIKGVAIATAISMFIGAVYAISHFIGSNKPISFRLENFAIKRRIVRNIISIGISPFAVNFASSCVALIVNVQLKKYGGDIAIGAFGVIISYLTIVIMVVLGVCQGAQPIIGFNYGAEKMKRVRETLFTSIKVSTIICIAGFLLFQLAPKPLTFLFIGNSEPIMTDMVIRGLRLCSILFPVIALQIVVSQYYMAVSKASYAIMLSIMRQVIFLIPLVMVLPTFWDLDGIWYSFPISDGIATIFAAILIWRENGIFRVRRKKS